MARSKTDSRRKRTTSTKFKDFKVSLSGTYKEEPKVNTKKRQNPSESLSFFSFNDEKKSTSGPNKRQKVLETVGIDNMTSTDYVPSTLDQPQLVTVKLVDLLKKHDGHGLFAELDILAGTCIGIYTGEIYASIEEFKQYLAQNPTEDNSYAMTIGGKIVDAAKKGNFTRYINFSDSQDNVEFIEGTINGRKVVKVRTLRDISEGEQILINYNTYEERASKLYYFLNPGDGWLSSKQVYENNSDHYQLMTMTSPLDAFLLKNNNHVYASNVGKVILEDLPLSQMEKEPDEIEINLPFLKTNISRKILDFDKADAFSPLMLACYLGQAANVEWLVKRNANINQQQNHSGKCPLFFALEGYACATNGTKDFLRIIKYLITNQANVCVHDRKDNTFMHKAILELSYTDFKSVMTLIAKQKNIDFTITFSYVNDSDLDIILSCFKNSLFDKAKVLLDLNPDYFNDNFKNKQMRQYLLSHIETMLADYSDEECEQLLHLLSCKKYNVPPEIIAVVENATIEFISIDYSF